MAAIGDVMAYVRNYFERWTYKGSITVEDGGEIIGVGDISPYTFVAIWGSACHDGVWRVAGNVLDGLELGTPGETFDGEIWALAPPPAFQRLCEEIAVFEAETPLSGVSSESFGPYSYSAANGQHGPLTWQEAYADHLRPYRRHLAGVRT